MDTVTVSPKYQVVIPRSIREQLRLRPGQKMQIWAAANRIELVPVMAIKRLRGFMKGIATDVPRDEDRQ